MSLHVHRICQSAILASTVSISLLGLMAAGAVAQAPIDPQMQAVLDSHAKLNPQPIPPLTPEDARQQPSLTDAVNALLASRGMKTEPEPVGSVVNRTIPGPGGDIPIRIYAPEGEGPFPVLAYWHGGGWVFANLDTYDASCRALCNAAGCVVVSCHYRQAPEHPFPAAAEDAIAAYQWVLENAADIGGDPARVAVGGESAGGNLAAVTALQARDQGLKAPVHQLLIYPVTNQAFDTESYQQHAMAKPLNKAMMQWFWKHYLSGDDGVNLPAATTRGVPAEAVPRKLTGNGASPLASPLRADNFADLPSATIITADIDPLRSEGQAYAEKLKAAGVEVTYINYEGVAHEFFGMGAVVDKAKQAVAKAAEGLKSAFGT